MKQRQDWEALGRLDPYWAILSYPDRRFGRWNRHEFFLTGQREVERVMATAACLGRPAAREAALDFGCGVGRLTQALASSFNRCYGVDISRNMIVRARQLNAAPNCLFLQNVEARLPMFGDHAFDLIYTNIVLQHINHRPTIKAYLAEFVRTLKPEGLLVFQLPDRIAWWKRLHPRPRLYDALHGLGLNPNFLYERLKLHPIRMNFIPQPDIVRWIEARGARVLDVQADFGPVAAIRSQTYYVTR